ncbi:MULTISPECIES: suppressor of fused domain protein [unclassified Luteococcus]|uniref:suppressor of fused domain protein n=1 Tax=unclassified Luteococcus TaxID=2639923 RepID=UPI00313C01D2
MGFLDKFLGKDANQGVPATTQAPAPGQPLPFDPTERIPAERLEIVPGMQNVVTLDVQAVHGIRYLLPRRTPYGQGLAVSAGQTELRLVVDPSGVVEFTPTWGSLKVPEALLIELWTALQPVPGEHRSPSLPQVVWRVVANASSQPSASPAPPLAPTTHAMPPQAPGQSARSAVPPPQAAAGWGQPGSMPSASPAPGSQPSARQPWTPPQPPASQPSAPQPSAPQPSARGGATAAPPPNPWARPQEQPATDQPDQGAAAADALGTSSPAAAQPATEAPERPASTPEHTDPMLGAAASLGASAAAARPQTPPQPEAEPHPAPASEQLPRETAENHDEALAAAAGVGAASAAAVQTPAQPDPRTQPGTAPQPDPQTQPDTEGQPDPVPLPAQGAQPDPEQQPAPQTQPDTEGQPDPAPLPAQGAQPAPEQQPNPEGKPAPAEAPVALPHGIDPVLAAAASAGAAGAGAEATAQPTAGRDDETAGWDVITEACRRVHGEQRPHQFRVHIPHFTGGNDPLSLVEAYRVTEGEPHWHYVGYGLSDIHLSNRTDDPEAKSGRGYELTYRLADPSAADPQAGPPMWPVVELQFLARYVLGSGNDFLAGDHMRLARPVTSAAPTTLTGLGFLADPQLAETRSPAGSVTFIQAVGLTEDEIDTMANWSGSRFLELLTSRIPLAVTRLQRESLLTDPQVRAARDEGLQRDGSNTGTIFANLLNWQPVGEGQTMVSLDVAGVRALHTLLPARLPFGRRFALEYGDGNGRRLLGFQPNQRPNIHVDQALIVVDATREMLDELCRMLPAQPGDFQLPNYPGLIWRVLPEPTQR